MERVSGRKSRGLALANRGDDDERVLRRRLLSRESNAARENNKIETSAAWHSRRCDSRAQCRPGRRQTNTTSTWPRRCSTAQHNSTSSTRAEDGTDPFIPGWRAVIRTAGNRKVASPQRPSMPSMPERASCFVLLRLLAQLSAGDNPPNSSRRRGARDEMAPLANGSACSLFVPRRPAEIGWLNLGQHCGALARASGLADPDPTPNRRRVSRSRRTKKRKRQTLRIR